MTGIDTYIFSQLQKEVESLPNRENEITQHLIELGYINLQKANALRKDDNTGARQLFFNELLQSDIFSEAYISKIALTGVENMLGTLLRTLTDIDQGITLGYLPKFGDRNLSTRLIHYRLDLFGMWPRETDAPFSALSIHKLNEIAEHANCNALQAFNHLADIENFTQHLLKTHPPEKFILTFRSPKVSDETCKKLDRRKAFQRQLLEDFGERSDFIKYMAREVLKNNPDKVDYNFLNRESVNPFKKFILRLIQVHQWQEGFYNGLLDSDMGELSLQSIIQAIDFYNRSNNHHIKTHRVITYVYHRYFIFNGLFFLQEYMIENQATAPNAGANILDNISNSLQHANEEDQIAFGKNFNTLKLEVNNDASQAPAERKGLLQRMYYGVTRWLKKAFRFARKIFSWIKNKISKVWAVLKRLFRNFFENLKLGIQAFLDGLKFFFGRKYIQTNTENQMIASKFSIDGDSFSVTSKQVSRVLETHLQSIGYNIKSMKFTLAIVAGILKIIMTMVNIITWPLLLINIIKIYNKISSSYQDIKMIAA